jgi:hypothetical protein
MTTAIPAPRRKIVISIKVKKIAHIRNASGEYFGEIQVEDLNCFISMLGCSPMISKETT